MIAIYNYGSGDANRSMGAVEKDTVDSDTDVGSLYDVIREIGATPGTGVISTKKLGTYFGANKERILGGRRLRDGETYQGSIRWWVEDLDKAREFGEFGEFGESEILTTTKTISNVISIDFKQNKLTELTKLTKKNVPGAPARRIAAK